MAALTSRRSPLASRSAPLAALLPVYRQVVHAVVALLVVAIPAGIALDHGGRFAWGWWLLAVLALLCVGGALLGKSSWQAGTPMRWAPPVFLLLFAGYAVLQSVPLPASLVRTLSPGSASAYELWLPAAAGQSASGNLSAPTDYPLSVAPGLSRDFAAHAVIVAAFAFVAVVVFANPQFATLLLAGLAITGVLHASLGIYQRMTVPGTTLGGIHLGQPFGFFVNRNNAAALLNVALAAAVGLIRWSMLGRSERREASGESSFSPLATRRSPLSQEPDASAWRLSEPANHRLHMLPLPRRAANSGGEGWGEGQWLLLCAVICGVVCAAGIVASGSRGALVGSAAGFVACLLVAVPAGRFLGYGLAAVLLFVAATYSLTSLGLESQAVERLSETMDEPVLADGRLDHWPDAVRAAVAYFPLGGGLGSYRYAHLPYQETTYGPWFANADNQWLEWWVEGGLVALLLIVAAVAVVGLAIRRLLTSSDPTDCGMAAAGAYGLAAIGVSQLFDFALLISPISIATTLLFSAVVARAAMVTPAKAKRPKPRAAQSQPGVAEPAARPVAQERSAANEARAANDARLAAATRQVTTLRPPGPLAPREASAFGSPEARLCQKAKSTPSPWEGREGRAGRAIRDVEPSPPRALEPDPPGGRVMGKSGFLTEASAFGSVAVITVGLALLLCLLWAQGVTSAAAHREGAVFASQAARNSTLLSLQPLEEAEARLSERIEAEPGNYALRLERTAVRVQLFRLHEAAKAAGTSPQTQQAAYDHSRLTERRQEFYSTLSPLAASGERREARSEKIDSPLVARHSPLASHPHAAGSSLSGERGEARSEKEDSLLVARHSPLASLLAAAADARAALEASPLSPEARIWLARLDFVTGETELTATRLEQVAQLRNGNLLTLDRVLELAIQSRHWGVARDAAKQTIHLSTGKVPEVLARLRRETPLRASEVVPDERAAILAAAEYELKHPDPDPKILTAAQNHLTPALSNQERELKKKIEGRELGHGRTRKSTEGGE